MLAKYKVDEKNHNKTEYKEFQLQIINLIYLEEVFSII